MTDLATVIPWAALVPTLGMLGKLWLDNRRLRLAEKDSDQKLRRAAQTLLMEAADKLSHAPQHAHDRDECINIVAAWMWAETRADVLNAERNSVEFLKRMGASGLIAGLQLSSDTEERE